MLLPATSVGGPFGPSSSCKRHSRVCGCSLSSSTCSGVLPAFQRISSTAKMRIWQCLFATVLVAECIIDRPGRPTKRQEFKSPFMTHGIEHVLACSEELRVLSNRKFFFINPGITARGIMEHDADGCRLNQIHVCTCLVTQTSSETKKGGNWVSHSRPPVSHGHCRSHPSATVCGHRLWDWAPPHGSLTQQTDQSALNIHVLF